MSPAHQQAISTVHWVAIGICLMAVVWVSVELIRRSPR